MNKEEIINLIKNTRTQYLIEMEHAREKLHKKFDDYTTHQMMSQLEFIGDMESRAYALQLLLEEIEEQ